MKKALKTGTRNCHRCAYHNTEDPNCRGVYVKGCLAQPPNHKPCNFGRAGYWATEFTPKFRKGDKVKFGRHTEQYQFDPECRDKVFVVLEDSRMCGSSGEEFVAEGLSGGYWDASLFVITKE